MVKEGSSNMFWKYKCILSCLKNDKKTGSLPAAVKETGTLPFNLLKYQILIWNDHVLSVFFAIFLK